MCSLVARALHPEGAYAVMTYGPPEDRVHLLGKEKYGWEVRVHLGGRATGAGARRCSSCALGRRRRGTGTPNARGCVCPLAG